MMDWTIAALLILGALIAYSPWLPLRHSKKMSGPELEETLPGLAWLRIAVPAGYLLWWLVLTLLAQSLYGQLGSWVFRLYAGVLLPGIAICNGLFAILTNVCPLPMRLGYRYVYQGEARRTGLYQTLLGLAAIGVIVPWLMLTRN
jgi:hypothetical protein